MDPKLEKTPHKRDKKMGIKYMYKYSAPLFVSEISIKPQEPPSHQLRKQKF